MHHAHKIKWYYSGISESYDCIALRSCNCSFSLALRRACSWLGFFYIVVVMFFMTFDWHNINAQQILLDDKRPCN